MILGKIKYYKLDITTNLQFAFSHDLFFEYPFLLCFIGNLNGLECHNYFLLSGGPSNQFYRPFSNIDTWFFTENVTYVTQEFSFKFIFEKTKEFSYLSGHLIKTYKKHSIQ
jgi:hypothetical protein